MVNLLFLLIFSGLYSCYHEDVNEDIMAQNISYPFDHTGMSYNLERNREPVVVKTVHSGSEYVIELPNDGTDYSLTIPLDQIGNAGAVSRRKSKSRQAHITDRELVSEMPKESPETRKSRKLVEKAFGMASSKKPRQPPSYSEGLVDIVHFYKRKEYEKALIETNQLLAFYPNSVRLLKMKGSILIKTGNYNIAIRSWNKAYSLRPNDKTLKKAIAALEQKINSKTDRM